jgi:predicted TIM-barrel fold metal-dependent hydrolase
MSSSTPQSESPRNAWRQMTPGPAGWQRTARAGDPDKYFMVSVDTHGIEPVDFLEKRIDKQYLSRIPRLKIDEDGAEWLITEGIQPMLVKPGRDAVKHLIAREAFEEPDYFQPYTSRMEPEDRLRYRAGADLKQRVQDAEADGVDAEIIFPNKGMLCFSTPDPVFQQAMFRVWNRWARENFADYWERFVPMAVIAPGDLEGAMTEVKWAAEQGFKGLTLPNKPIFGPPKPGELQYNDKHFDPLWSLIAEVDLPMTFHVSTGRDPRGVTGLGGAVINYVCHSMPTVMEPLVNLISSGVFERHPTLKAGSIEGGIGWVPWMIEAMDYSFQAHHMWVRPVMPELPSFYYRRNCFSAFMEDHVTLPRAEELNLVDNLMWSNDYPHHEGSWPHSAESIERQMSCLSEQSRAKILGLNAARVFKLKVPVGKR